MRTLDGSKTDKPTQISLLKLNYIKLLPFLFYSDYRASTIHAILESFQSAVQVKLGMFP